MNRYKMDNWVISKLSEPFSEEEVHWRPAPGGSALAYIDARQVVDRLNHVVGAENWQDTYAGVSFVNTEQRDKTDYQKIQETLRNNNTDPNSVFWFKNGVISGLKDKKYANYVDVDVYYGGIRCDLTILGVSKQDVGTASMAEQMKGAHSDALKRAAVKFGIGAYLYDLKNLTGARIEQNRVVEPPELPEWALPVEKANPDELIKSLFEKARNKPDVSRHELEAVFSEISVMGNYNTAAPLIVKRWVYEQINKMLSEADTE